MQKALLEFLHFMINTEIDNVDMLSLLYLETWTHWHNKKIKTCREI